MITSTKTPRTFAELLYQFESIQDDVSFVRQLRNMQILTDTLPPTTIKTFPNSSNASIDLRGLTPSGAPIPAIGGPFIPYNNDAFVINQTTNSPTGNATLLSAAYTRAKALTPNGAALSTTNRACLIVAPGEYDFAANEFTLDASYVDVIGLTSIRENQYITSTKTLADTATIRQSADDIRIANLWVTIAGSLTVDCSAYYPTSSLPSSKLLNCRFGPTVSVFNSFGAMRLIATYSGYYEDCVCDGAGWGYGGGSSFSGTAINCTNSVEGGFATSGTCSGTLINCHADTRYGYGGQDGTFSGIAIACTAGTSSFGGSSGGLGAGTFSGKAYLCTAGSNSFGSGGATSSITSAARIISCSMTSMAFGTPAAGGIIASSVDSTGIVNFPSVGFTNPMTTAGDIIYGGAAGVGTRRAATTAGAILYLDATLTPQWLAPPTTTGATLQFIGGALTWTGGTPPADDESDFIGSRVFNFLSRQVFNISTYHG